MYNIAYRRKYMVTADHVNIIDDARIQLLNCTTKDAARKVFDDFQISDLDAKIALLKRCMQLQNVYAIPGNEPLTKEKFYEEALTLFVDGPWRELI